MSLGGSRVVGEVLRARHGDDHHEEWAVSTLFIRFLVHFRFFSLHHYGGVREALSI